MKYEGIIKKSRTLDFAMLLGIMGAVQITLPALQLDPVYSGYVNMAVAVMIAVLRYKTKNPVGGK